MEAMTAPWHAPVAPGPVRGRVAVPGSKSITNRALVLAALAEAPTTITGALQARDTELMTAALRRLGSRITSDEPGGRLLVEPGPLRGNVR
ncbi:MAG: hypothetical protein RLZ55_1623, partial [Actinomycetota bacterium]